MSGPETSLNNKLISILCADLTDVMGYSERDRYKVRLELIGLEAEANAKVFAVLK